MDRRDLCKMGVAGIGTMVFSRPVRAMEKFTKASEKKKWVILYGTQCGSTGEYAGFINEGLGGIADVVDIAKTTPNVSDYEFFIIGGWINSGNLTPSSITNFVSSNKEALKTKIMGLFTVCGNNGKPVEAKQIKDYLTDKLVKTSGVTDKPAKLFNGRAGNNCKPPYTYDLVSEDAGIAFGQEIQATATKGVQQAFPQRFELYQNSPNPFNPTTTIRYSIPHTAEVVLSVCALDGRRMATLFSGTQAAGTYEMTWDGSRLAPGFYLYQLEAGGFRQLRTARRVGR
ncbi:MAG: hypothetical protein JXA18_07800 [Chitinispirillaceae bacterium]|nr:hypothetical protein [Chitinispirillaceae bacterium]